MSKYVDCVIGHAVGDAMGVPTEFLIRERLQKKPVTKMIGRGQHDVPAGSWSDDTSMAIATIDSFIKKGVFDYEDILTNFYYWLRDGAFTPNGENFDAGRTCIRAIINFSKGYEPLKSGLTDTYSNGNGSLMRVYPVALYAHTKKLNEKEIVSLTNDLSSLTHAHEISKLGCYIYVRYMLYLLSGLDKSEAYKKIKELDYSYYSSDALEKYSRILNSDIDKYDLDEISSSGYVVDTLEATLWVLLNHSNYEYTILEAINLGNDTDTIAAIAGSLAGIIYGIKSIPKEWLNTLIKRDYLEELALEFERIVNK